MICRTDSSIWLRAALVSGSTDSSDFEGANNAYHGGGDTFVAKLSASGTLQWVTYLGGSAEDEGSGIDLDADGSAYVAGTTWSSDFEGRINDFHSIYLCVERLRENFNDGQRLLVESTPQAGLNILRLDVIGNPYHKPGSGTALDNYSPFVDDIAGDIPL